MMLNLYSPETKAQIVTSILREAANGADVRACCHSQGITYQTFIDWRSWAQKANRLHGHESINKKVKRSDPPLQNALQAALTKVVEVAQGPDREDPPPLPRPDLVAASTGFDLPGPFCGADMPAPDADFMAAVERDIAAQEQAQAAPVAPEPEPITEPISNPDEGVDMPRKKVEPELSRMARTLAARFPWLAELDARTNREFGPKPHRLDDTKGYNQWTQYRKSLMSKKQAAEFAAFYGPNRGKRGVTQDTPAAASKLEKSANGVEAKVEKLLTRAAHSNGTDLAHQRLGRALVKDPEVMQATIETLRAQHNEVQQELALHPEALAQAIHVEPITAAPRRVATSADMAAEINRMQRIITVLTAENMRLRGLL